VATRRAAGGPPVPAARSWPPAQPGQDGSSRRRSAFPGRRRRRAEPDRPCRKIQTPLGRRDKCDRGAVRFTPYDNDNHIGGSRIFLEGVTLGTRAKRASIEGVWVYGRMKFSDVARIWLEEGHKTTSK